MSGLERDSLNTLEEFKQYRDELARYVAEEKPKEGFESYLDWVDNLSRYVSFFDKEFDDHIDDLRVEFRPEVIGSPYDLEDFIEQDLCEELYDNSFDYYVASDLIHKEKYIEAYLYAYEDSHNNVSIDRLIEVEDSISSISEELDRNFLRSIGGLFCEGEIAKRILSIVIYDVRENNGRLLGSVKTVIERWVPQILNNNSRDRFCDIIQQNIDWERMAQVLDYF